MCMCVSITWPASLLIVIPPLLFVVEGEKKGHGSLHSLSPEGGLGCGWWERVALPDPVHWAVFAGVCICPQVCGDFGGRHQPAAPLSLCCLVSAQVLLVEGSQPLCSGQQGVDLYQILYGDGVDPVLGILLALIPNPPSRSLSFS